MLTDGEKQVQPREDSFAWAQKQATDRRGLSRAGRSDEDSTAGRGRKRLSGRLGELPVLLGGALQHLAFNQDVDTGRDCESFRGA